mmetsp:Transcript_144972/g.450057  ORF Transcript_144972/g.450057 Transcript_144972/m.450057 type:complete len:201 (+) Transcript_144972:84-686(+)
MAVDICAMQENLRWEDVPPGDHLAELAKYGEFNHFVSEYFDPPEPLLRVLDALALLMGLAGDARQIVTHITGMRNADDRRDPEHFQQFLARLRDRDLSELASGDQERFSKEMTRWIDWPKFNHQRGEYEERVPMNSYDVLKCSQACFHLFEWLRGLLPTDKRPPRCVPSDLEAFCEREAELRPLGCWPEDPPPGPQERTD